MALTLMMLVRFTKSRFKKNIMLSAKPTVKLLIEISSFSKLLITRCLALGCNDTSQGYVVYSMNFIVEYNQQSYKLEPNEIAKIAEKCSLSSCRKYGR